MGVVLITTLITLAASAAHAQVHGYALAGPAGVSGFVNVRNITVHASGGGEVFLGKFVSAGGEGGLFDRLVTVSANAGIHAANEERIVPFLTGGFSRFGIGDGEGGFDAWNIGGGADAWMGRHAGVRFELRDYLRKDRRGDSNYWAFRVGVVFR
jgi:hypothetical protein